MNPGDENTNPPLRELSLDEYNRIRKDLAGEEEVVLDEEKPMELGRKIWDLAIKGKNRDQIARKLKLPMETLDEALNSYKIRLGLSIDTLRLLDNERIDRMIAYWMPVALEGPLQIEKIGQDGAVFTEADFDIPLKASHFILNAMERRIKILGGSGMLANLGLGVGPDGDKPYSERNVVVWLKEVLPGIERLTREVEVLTNGDGSNGSNGENGQ